MPENKAKIAKIKIAVIGGFDSFLPLFARLLIERAAREDKRSLIPEISESWGGHNNIELIPSSAGRILNRKIG